MRFRVIVFVAAEADRESHTREPRMLGACRSTSSTVVLPVSAVGCGWSAIWLGGVVRIGYAVPGRIFQLFSDEGRGRQGRLDLKKMTALAAHSAGRRRDTAPWARLGARYVAGFHDLCRLGCLATAKFRGRLRRLRRDGSHTGIVDSGVVECGELALM